MQPLNFCRQAKKQILETIGRPHAVPLDYRKDLLGLLDRSVKFQMPHGGRILNDLSFRALEGKDARLPFPVIAVEYTRYTTDHDLLRESRGEVSPDDGYPKAIILAEEKDGKIWINVMAWRKVWIPLPPIATFQKDPFHIGPNGKAQFAVMGPQSMPVPIEDYADEVGCLFDLLNALACSNVRAERLPARKPAKRAKGALPFDSYHYLTVDAPGRPSGQGAAIGDRRSPREHIRRGHIRRLADGRAIWINATMVNAGIGSRVDKSYVMRAIG